MKVWPFGVALRGVMSNRLRLRWLKTVVVSAGEKAQEMRQVGTGKASVSEPLTTCRNKQLAPEPGRLNGSGMSLAGARVLARRCPAWRRREPGLPLLHGTWEGGCRHCRLAPEGAWGNRERAARQEPEALSTVAASAGGPARSSGEAQVIRAERRGRLICRSVRANNRGRPWEEAGEHVGTAGQAV